MLEFIGKQLVERGSKVCQSIPVAKYAKIVINDVFAPAGEVEV